PGLLVRRVCFFFFQAEDGIRYWSVTGVQTCALPIFNPRVKVIIKYPNWYEHFQGLGYDLDVEAKQFDAIYTGTESRDPYITDQRSEERRVGKECRSRWSPHH